MREIAVSMATTTIEITKGEHEEEAVGEEEWERKKKTRFLANWERKKDQHFKRPRKARKLEVRTSKCDDNKKCGPLGPIHKSHNAQDKVETAWPDSNQHSILLNLQPRHRYSSHPLLLIAL